MDCSEKDKEGTSQTKDQEKDDKLAENKMEVETNEEELMEV